jgi:hypothetical protein
MGNDGCDGGRRAKDLGNKDPLAIDEPIAPLIVIECAESTSHEHYHDDPKQHPPRAYQDGAYLTPDPARNGKGIMPFEMIRIEQRERTDEKQGCDGEESHKLKTTPAQGFDERWGNAYNHRPKPNSPKPSPTAFRQIIDHVRYGLGEFLLLPNGDTYIDHHQKDRNNE